MRKKKDQDEEEKGSKVHFAERNKCHTINYLLPSLASIETLGNIFSWSFTYKVDLFSSYCHNLESILASTTFTVINTVTIHSQLVTLPKHYQDGAQVGALST